MNKKLSSDQLNDLKNNYIQHRNYADIKKRIEFNNFLPGIMIPDNSIRQNLINIELPKQ